ncbi:serine hydrolase domain-containing protein [Anaeromicropila herbilytica]|uniref:Serine hydrolase n=1 Tax=Anaeromicropila herbilytica TaxID=2785025 RepID=A0A7R7ELS6_9FIRM|nr:serine hydrolase [Anaeromicropila herbilytica]BCN31108.1 serine hydrolase [Anaeromicropila herbilytica]
MNIDIEIDEYIKKKRYRQVNSVLVSKNSEIIAERYYNGFNKDSRNPIKSVAKSIMSIGVGIALDKGLISSIDEPICKYISEFNERRDPFHKMITIRHLLTMTSGILWNGGVHYHCPMLMQMKHSNNWISHITDCVVTNRPGTKYNYKEWDVILLAKVLDSIGSDMFDLINENLYKLLGIHSERWYKSTCGVYYSVADGDEDENESLSNLTAREMLKIGQLLLQKGFYNNKQIISSDYMEQAVTPTQSNPSYGYLFWRGENWYGCRGYGGQRIIVIPKKELVIVTQATPTSRGMSYDDVIWFCEGLV